MKLNKYNLTAFGIIGLISSFLISKSGLEVYISVPLALIIAAILVTAANKLAAKDAATESDPPE